MRKPILVIDDSDIDAEFTLHALMECGIINPVLVANTGGEAMNILADRQNRQVDQRVAFIFLEINMPGMNGFEILTALKADPFFEEIPVVIATGSVLLDDQQRAEALGAVGFLPKVLDISKYVESLCATLHPYREALE